MLPLLHISPDHAFILRPLESHHVFGAGFVLLGSLMTTESLAGGVWYRSRTRLLFFPATLILLGWGMLAVTVIEPENRIAHFAMGLPMIVGGWSEAQHRLGNLSRVYADRFIIASLCFAALETALFHLDGPMMSGGFITHASLAATGVAIGGLRYFQSQAPTSLARSLLISGAVILIGIELFIDAIFQTA